MQTHYTTEHTYVQHPVLLCSSGFTYCPGTQRLYSVFLYRARGVQSCVVLFCGNKSEFMCMNWSNRAGVLCMYVCGQVPHTII